jgi:hypothetical protein
MAIEKAEGVNESERYLQKLCDKTFLSLWSYPAVYRDDFAGKITDGKEVCDLLVVFENHIIIFSDKDCQFPDSGRLEIDWNRWFKKAIQKSAEQAWGAEKWIKKYPDRLFLDRSCTTRFPLAIPDLSIAKFHLIVVANDSSMRCQKELGGSGSLMIDSSVKGLEHYAGKNGGLPFFVGDINPSRTFVHILDSTSLDIVLGKLDTISDFVSYLTKKEKFLRSEMIISAAGEEELLAYYLKNMNDKNEHDFVIPSHINGQIAHLTFGEGHWEEFIQSPEREAQILADRISYFWDMLIEQFSKHIMEETQYFTTHRNIKQIEPLLGFLARESRFRRRYLSKAFLGLIESAPKNMRATRYVCPLSTQEPYYVFLTFPQFDWMTYEQYRVIRRDVLDACCSTVKSKFPDAQHIIGIATQPRLDAESHSEDAIYFDATDWTEEEAIRAKEDSEKLNILKNPHKFITYDQEYPNQDAEQNHYPLHGRIIQYIDPTEPVAQNDWEVEQ